MFTKCTFLFSLITVFFISVSAQKIVEERVQLSSGQEISLDFEFAENIIIKTWEKNEIYVKVEVNINDNENNDLFELEKKEYSDEVSLKSNIKNLNSLRKNLNISIGRKEGTYQFSNGNCISIILLFEVYLPNDFPLEIETISGDIEIEKLHGPLDIETVSGFIDIGLPEDLKADIRLETITGEMFSNFEFDPQAKNSGLDRIGGGDIKTTINGGGVRINLETVSGDIYLRKK